jgi:hypothetical protein
VTKAKGALLLVVFGAAVVTLSGCGTAFVEHEARIVLSDPTGRLGAPPWKVAILDPIALYDRTAESALSLSGGELRAGAPYVGRFSTEETAWIWQGKPRPRVLDAGLVVPALSSEGWWRASIVILDDGTSRGYARLCPWGHLTPDGEAEVLMMRGKAQRKEEGWSLDLTVEIPPARSGPAAGVSSRPKAPRSRG